MLDSRVAEGVGNSEPGGAANESRSLAPKSGARDDKQEDGARDDNLYVVRKRRG
jgi:hypothetical protein